MRIGFLIEVLKTAMSDIYKLIKKLSDAFGVSGNEENVRHIIQNNIKSYVDKIYADKMVVAMLRYVQGSELMGGQV